MSDNEVEDVSFLPAGENLHRKAVYEPSAPQRCKQLVCSQGRAAVIAVTVALFLLVITLIAAFARPGCAPCAGTETLQTTETPASTTPKYISTSGEIFPWQDVRLPKNIIPDTYDIFLHPNISKSFFNGNVKITCSVLNPTDFIVFHIKDMNLTKVSVKDLKTGKDIGVVKQLEYKDAEQVYIKLNRGIVNGDRIELSVDFDAQLISKLAGFYKSKFKLGSEDRYLATTHFEPTDARAAFPCFDEPSFKATFRMSIVREPKQISLFNMPLVNSEQYGSDGLMKDSFDVSVKMSTYLVAFVVCDGYAHLTSSTKTNITVRVFAPEDQIQRAQFALDAAVKILHYYEDFFGVPYPLPKQDLIAIPDFAAGAMENWGLITYRMTAILYDKDVSSARTQQWVAVVVAHELAHQWFGNLVTMEWWDDLWLNEGFASYVEYIGSSVVKPEWHMKEQFVKDDLQTALYLDSLSNSHPISVPVDDPSEINELFDSISYSKGASIIRMLNNRLGEDNFKKGLKAYLTKFKFNNAANNDLWTALSKSVPSGSSLDVVKMMNTWTKQMGYPVITMEKHGSKLVVKQERFLLYNKSKSEEKFTSPYGYKWYVPFSYTTSASPSKVTMKDLTEISATYPWPDNIEWIKGNHGMFGYYRVNYDTDNWEKLIQQLNRNHTVFTAAERAGLIDDAFQLARAGLLGQKYALDMTLYLVHETDYLPWTVALENFDYLEARLQDKPVYTLYKKYLKEKIMKNILSSLTWEDTGDHLHKFLRSVMLSEAIHLGHPDFINKGKELYEQWTQNASSINNFPNLKVAIYRAGLEYGGDTEWEKCWQRYLSETVPSEKRQLLRVLAFTKDTSLLMRLLRYGLDSDKVKSQDTGLVMGAVASNSQGGHILAWRFLQQNYEEFLKRYGGLSFVMPHMIKSVAGGFDTEFDYKEVKTFFSTHDSGPGERAVSQVLEKIQMNSDWLKLHEEEVTDWFNAHDNP